jgi:thioredoxin reductase (NADPH)
MEDMSMSFDFNLKALDNAGANTNDYDVVIIGGGPAGATAALYTARAELRTLVIDKGLTAGALGITGKIANYPGILEPISGADLLARMREQAESFGAVFLQDKVQGVDLTNEPKQIFANSGNYTARAVIVATGSMGRGQRVKGEDEFLGRGVSYCATCDAAFFQGQDVVVVGNSDEALEEAIFLTRFVRQVHLLSPTPELKAPAALVTEATTNPKLALYPGAALREVVGNGHVQGVRYAQRGAGEQTLPVTGAFIYLQGGKPITDFLGGQLPVGETGCVLVDAEYRTQLPGVFAVGDILCHHVKQAVVAAAEGAVAAMAVDKYLHGRKQMVTDWAK